MGLASKLSLFLGICAAGEHASAKNWYRVHSGDKVTAVFSEETIEGKKEVTVRQDWEYRNENATKLKIVTKSMLNGGFLPIDFSVDRKGKSEEFSVSANFSNGKAQFSFFRKKPKRETRKKTHAPPTRSIFYTMLPRVFAKNTKNILLVNVIMEDVRGPDLETRHVQAKPVKSTKTVRGLECLASEVDFNGIKGTWYYTEQGELCEVTLPQVGTRLVLVTEDEAKK